MLGQQQTTQLQATTSSVAVQPPVSRPPPAVVSGGGDTPPAAKVYRPASMPIAPATRPLTQQCAPPPPLQVSSTVVSMPRPVMYELQQRPQQPARVVHRPMPVHRVPPPTFSQHQLMTQLHQRYPPPPHQQHLWMHNNVPPGGVPQPLLTNSSTDSGVGQLTNEVCTRAHYHSSQSPVQSLHSQMKDATDALMMLQET